jgi:hypothetical protein
MRNRRTVDGGARLHTDPEYSHRQPRRVIVANERLRLRTVRPRLVARAGSLAHVRTARQSPYDLGNLLRAKSELPAKPGRACHDEALSNRRL